MKKYTLIIAIFSFICINSIASDKSLFQLDEKKISSEFQQLDKLEIVISDNDLTLSELQAENNELLVLSNIDIKKSNSFSVHRITGDDEDKTMMYVLIGVGALVLLGLGAWLMFCLIG